MFIRWACPCFVRAAISPLVRASSSVSMVSLIVATTSDPASIGPATALLDLDRPSWVSGPNLQDYPSFQKDNVRLLQLNGSIVGEDHLDERWESLTGEPVKEVIFMSKHSAVSATASLTVHPIGVPHLCPHETAPQGGRPGWAAPPCPRLGHWLNLLRDVATKEGLLPEFEVTLEATHHGPEVNVPAMFVEIGSTEEYWGRKDAAVVVAKVFWQGLGLNGGPDIGDWTKENKGEKVLLGLGGGHYVPRHMDVIRKGDLWVGHLLSGYSLPMQEPGKTATISPDYSHIGGRWKEAIREAFKVTTLAYPDGEVIAHLDSKSFKGWQRNAIIGFLALEKIPVGKPEDFCSKSARK